MVTIYFYHSDKFLHGGNWGLTVNQQLANKMDKNYRIATSKDLNDFMCATGYIFRQIIRVQEGAFRWKLKRYYYPLGLSSIIGNYEPL